MAPARAACNGTELVDVLFGRATATLFPAFWRLVSAAILMRGSQSGRSVPDCKRGISLGGPTESKKKGSASETTTDGKRCNEKYEYAPGMRRRASGGSQWLMLRL